jgi:hypothetical protein
VKQKATAYTAKVAAEKAAADAEKAAADTAELAEEAEESAAGAPVQSPAPLPEMGGAAGQARATAEEAKREPCCRRCRQPVSSHPGGSRGCGASCINVLTPEKPRQKCTDCGIIMTEQHQCDEAHAVDAEETVIEEEIKCEYKCAFKGAYTSASRECKCASVQQCKCAYKCAYKSASRDSLKGHMVSEHNYFKCNLCGEVISGYYGNRSLKYHMNSNHKEQTEKLH